MKNGDLNSEKTKHVFENGYYVITNKAVAKSFLFNEQKDCERFLFKLDQHLSPLCEILGYALLRDEFQLVIKMKSRKDIESYYLDKYAKDEGTFIPQTTYIFAQAMANMQSGYAKWFNYKYQRDGGLMKGRYTRLLIENEAILNQELAAVNALQRKQERSQIWTFGRKGDGYLLGRIGDTIYRSSRRYYEAEGGVKRSVLKCFRLLNSDDLRGQFKNLPPKSLKHLTEAQKVKNLVNFILLKKR